MGEAIAVRAGTVVTATVQEEDEVTTAASHATGEEAGMKVEGVGVGEMAEVVKEDEAMDHLQETIAQETKLTHVDSHHLTLRFSPFYIGAGSPTQTAYTPP